MFLLLDGVLRVEEDGGAWPSTVPGALLGERAAPGGGPAHLDARRGDALPASPPCRPRELDRGALRELSKDHRRTQPDRGAERLRVHLCGVRGSTPAPGIEFVRYGGHTSCVALRTTTAQRVAAPDADPRRGRRGCRSHRACWAARRSTERSCSATCTGITCSGCRSSPRLTTRSAHVSVMLPEQQSGEDAAQRARRDDDAALLPDRADASCAGDWPFGTIAPGEYEIEGFEVLVREIPHKGGRTLGYRVGDGHSTLAYLPDHCPTALGPGEDGWGEYHPAALELARDADVLLHDAAAVPRRSSPRRRTSATRSPTTRSSWRKRAGMGAVVLFHHRHDRTDEDLDELARRLGRSGSESSPQVSVAVEETSIEL